jgi:hypothetical protein
MPNPWPRRLVALLLHAPGLWWVYRESLPRELRRANLRAALATAAAVVATFWLAPPPWDGFDTVLGVWLAGHLLWGLYLSANLSGRA